MMEPTDDDIIRLFEGRTSVQQDKETDAIRRTMEGKNTQQDDAVFANSQASLAVESYAEALCRKNPQMSLVKARESANDSLERFVQTNRDKYSTQKDLMEAATAFLARMWLETGRSKKTSQRAASQNAKPKQPMGPSTHKINRESSNGR